MRFFGPDPFTLPNSTPSSRANRRTPGLAWACVNAASLTGDSAAVGEAVDVDDAVGAGEAVAVDDAAGVAGALTGAADFAGAGALGAGVAGAAAVAPCVDALAWPLSAVSTVKIAMP